MVVICSLDVTSIVWFLSQQVISQETEEQGLPAVLRRALLRRRG